MVRMINGGVCLIGVQKLASNDNPEYFFSSKRQCKHNEELSGS